MALSHAKVTLISIINNQNKTFNLLKTKRHRILEQNHNWYNIFHIHIGNHECIHI